MPTRPALAVLGGAVLSPARVYLDGLTTEASRRTQEAALRRVAHLLSGGGSTWDELAWEQLRYADTAALRAALIASVAPTTANRYLSALRSVLREAWRLGLLSREDMERTCDLRRVPGEATRRGRALGHGELRRLRQACAGRGRRSPGAARDGALIALLADCALRRAEAAALDLEHWDPQARSLLVHGKGGRTTEVPVSTAASAAVERWLGVRAEAPGPLFCPVHRAGRLLLGTRLSGGAVNRIVRRRAAAAGLPRTSAHDLRRTAVSDLLDGADPLVVRLVSRHRCASSMALYDRRGQVAARRAVEHLAVTRRGR